MEVYIEPIGRLINEFSKLPGVGKKTAQRYAYKVIDMTETQAQEFRRGGLPRLQGARRPRHLRGQRAERRHRFRKAA